MSSMKQNICPEQRIGESFGLKFLQDYLTEDTYGDNIATTATKQEWSNIPSATDEPQLRYDQYQSSLAQSQSAWDSLSFENAYKTLPPEINEFLNEQPEMRNAENVIYEEFSSAIGLTQNLDSKGIMLFSSSYASVISIFYDIYNKSMFL